jgi:hypothetical protein
LLALSLFLYPLLLTSLIVRDLAKYPNVYLEKRSAS